MHNSIYSVCWYDRELQRLESVMTLKLKLTIIYSCTHKCRLERFVIYVLLFDRSMSNQVKHILFYSNWGFKMHKKRIEWGCVFIHPQKIHKFWNCASIEECNYKYRMKRYCISCTFGFLVNFMTQQSTLYVKCHSVTALILSQCEETFRSTDASQWEVLIKKRGKLK